MGEKTGITWTDHTANFWWGCQRVSPGCEHCYAETLAVVRRKLPVWGPPSTTARELKKGVWRDVPKWNAAAIRDGVRRRLFVSSMADIFEDHPQVTQWRADALALLATCTGLDVQLLTKRPQNVRAMVPPAWLTSWPAHVWIGCTVEDQRRAEERIPHLLAVPAPVRFLSCEPLLEAVKLREDWLLGAFEQCPDETQGEDDECRGCPGYQRPGGDYCGAVRGPRISWVIVGGESGTGARPFDIAWARGIVAQCREAGVPVFVKQMGDNAVETSRVCPQHSDGFGCGDYCKLHRFATESASFRAHHGADPSEWDEDLRVQEFPETH